MKAVVFKLGGSEYAVDVGDVLEVIRMRHIVPIPETRDYVEGVINRRGSVVPVLNINKKLGTELVRGITHPRMILSLVEGHTIAFLVDEVVGVVGFDQKDLLPPAQVLREAAFLKGVLNINGRMIFVADVGAFLSHQEQHEVFAVNERVQIREKATHA